MAARIWAIQVLLLAPGCMIVQVGVTNPVPGMTTIAVVPFFNQSHEREVDGRRFAFAYFTELQKVPGFKVVPVGVVEQAIHDSGLAMDSPADALKLCELLGVDAVVIGSVTDYDPYYPPRIGLQVAWYSPYPWTFVPGPPTDMQARHRYEELEDQLEDELEEREGSRWQKIKRRIPGLSQRERSAPQTAVVRAQSPSANEISSPAPNPTNSATPENADSPAAPEANLQTEIRPTHEPDSGPQLAPLPPGEGDQDSGARPSNNTAPSNRNPMAGKRVAARPGAVNHRMPGNGARQASHQQSVVVVPEAANCPPGAPGASGMSGFVGPLPDWNPLEPVMSYTRVFDGTDADLCAQLRDYVELSGDLRSGGWRAYLHRSEDFIRFTSHRMIVEMLTLHGGESKRRVVFKFRKQK